MPEERLLSITSSSHLAPDDVARHTFGSVRRGFDPNEVRSYLESIAIALRGVGDRESELLEALADAERRAANPVLDEATLTAAIGAETARVLHSAHEVAAEMTAKAEAESAGMLAEAREEIDQHRTRTEARLSEQTTAAEAAVAELSDRTNQQAAAGLEAARTEAEELLTQAREQCRAMVDEAQGLRARVLADLAKRRKVLHAQIEQLRAGRERLSETVQDVRRSIDAIAEDLFAAEDNARLAAETAGRQAAGRPDEGSPEEMAAVLLAEEAEAVVEVVEVVSVETVAVETAPDGAPLQEPEAGAEAGPEAGDTSPVDALFAKIRAATGEPTGEVPAPGGTTVAPADEASPPDVPAAAGTSDGPDSGAEDPDAGADLPPEDRNPLAIQRDELIDPIVTTLARRLKRTLQDSQNDLLDTLRSRGSGWSGALLPDATEHVDTFATAALPALEQAAAAGVSFVGADAGPVPRADTLIGLAHGLAEAVVDPLRRRLSDDDAGLSDADEPVVAEYIGSAFREWKGERIERLAGDQVVAAFSLGTMAAVDAEPGAQLEWVAVAGSGDAACPDCEDNGLNGSQPPREEFPTGHLHPPAHPGCRCLLAPAAP